MLIVIVPSNCYYLVTYPLLRKNTAMFVHYIIKINV